MEVINTRPRHRWYYTPVCKTIDTSERTEAGRREYCGPVSAPCSCVGWDVRKRDAGAMMIYALRVWSFMFPILAE